jgi:hypothetical protein
MKYSKEFQNKCGLHYVTVLGIAGAANGVAFLFVTVLDFAMNTYELKRRCCEINARYCEQIEQIVKRAVKEKKRLYRYYLWTNFVRRRMQVDPDVLREVKRRVRTERRQARMPRLRVLMKELRTVVEESIVPPILEESAPTPQVLSRSSTGCSVAVSYTHLTLPTTPYV